MVLTTVTVMTMVILSVNFSDRVDDRGDDDDVEEGNCVFLVSAFRLT